MEDYEREYLVSRIIYGKAIIDFRDEILVIYPLTMKERYLANREFKRVYENSLLSGIYTRDEMLEIMIEQGVWSQEDEKQIGINKTRIEDAKIKVYKSFYRPKAKDKAKEELEQIKKEQYGLLERKHSNDSNDCEGMATYARWNWVIENTTYKEDGTKYNFDDHGIGIILRKFNAEAINVDSFREMSRTDPWRSMWSISKAPESLFNRRASELTDDQVNLVSWSMLYDNIGESMDSPSDDVIEDDDAIDGWLIQERRKRDKESNKYKLDGFDDKHSNADEVYIMASSQEEIDEIYDLNDQHGRRKVKSREKEVVAAGDDGIRHHNFDDMRVKKMSDAAAKFGK
jgi:hypothetical protein